MAIVHYLALVHRSPLSEFGVSFPDFPGCITAGTNLGDARDMAKEALQFHIDGMLAENLEIPSPERVVAIPTEPLEEPVAVFLVPVRVKVLDWVERAVASVQEVLEGDSASPATRAYACYLIHTMKDILDHERDEHSIEVFWIPLGDGGHTLEFESDLLSRSFALVWDDSNSVKTVYFVFKVEGRYRFGLIKEDSAFASLAAWLLGKCSIEEVVGITLSSR